MAPQVDIKIISQFNTACGLLHILPAEEKLGEFLCPLLTEVPGCSSFSICLREASAPFGNIKGIQCRDCAGQHKQFVEAKSYPCALADEDKIRAYPLETTIQLYGYILVTVCNVNEYTLYEPYVKNLGNSIALVLENRWHKNRLETLVNERTLALKNSEEKFRRVFEDSGVGMVLSDHKGRYVQVNRAMTEILGYSKEELLSMSSTDITHPGYPTQDSDIYRKLWAGESDGFSIEKRYLHKDGHEIWGDVHVSPIRDSNGNTVSTLGQLQDITERKRAEEIIANLARFPSENPNPVLRIASDGNILFNNQASAPLLKQWAVKEKQVIPESLQKMVLDSLQKGKLIHKEVMCMDRGFNLTLAPVTDFNYVNIYGLDITEQKQAEDELRESEARFRRVVMEAPFPIMLHASDGEVLQISNVWTEITGYSHSEILTIQDWTRKAYGEEKAVVQKKIDSLYSLGKRKKEGEFTIRTKQGNEVVWDFSSAPLGLLPDGRELVMSIAMDVTERKQAERAFIEGQRLSAIGEMAAAVAHDFNNALQAIFGNLELSLLEPGLPDSAREYLETLKTAATDAAARVRLLQRFGGTKQVKSEYHPINFNTVISNVIKQSRPLWKDEVEKKGLLISIATEYGDIPDISGNEGELRAVVYNIIKNCIEAMPRGGKITIATGKSEEGVYLSITDTGKGMDKETAARIFQPFYSTKGFEPGRGLGMSGVYTIIKEHKGQIFVKESAVEKGTSIQIILPPSEKEELKKSEETIADYKDSARILWVDDEELIRQSGKLWITKFGYKGDVAASGQEALEYLEQNEYDLVITDLGMPGMSGWQLAEKIKEKFKGKIKVAVVTGWGDQVGEVERKKHGVGYVLAKPVNLAQLKNLIREAMQFKQK
ncbi:PAS domain S-box protein [Candidatus Riflebacteria bacterium]